MLQIILGEEKNTLYQIDKYFKEHYEPKWIEHEICKRIIEEVDKSTILTSTQVINQTIGKKDINQLSRSTKTLLLIWNNPSKIFNASFCADECSQFLIEFGNSKDIVINLNHIMDFGQNEFTIKIINSNIIVHNMKEYVKEAVKYL